MRTKSNKDDEKQSKYRESTRMLLTAAKDTQWISLARRCRCHPSMAKLSIVVLRALFSGYCAFGMITSWLAYVRGDNTKIIQQIVREPASGESISGGSREMSRNAKTEISDENCKKYCENRIRKTSATVIYPGISACRR